MSNTSNKTLIGIFVVGGAALLLIAIMVFGSGALFKKTSTFVLYFDGSVKGLAVGAPVMFRGVSIGSVKDISLIYDEKAGTIMLPVVVKIEQDRIKGAPSFGQSGGEKKMIKLGLRGKLEVLSFLTGQLMVSFDFYPNNPPQLRNIKDLYPELPTLPISPDIFKLMNEVPIKEIAKNLEATAVGINRLVNESDLQSSLYDMRETFQETKKAMQSVRLLTEYLEQHPEAILQGKSVTKGE